MRIMKLFLIALLALPGFAQSIYRVKVETTAGNFVIEVHRDWAPHAADRFRQLVDEKYFDDSRFYRTVAGKWVQFGIAGKPKVAQKWRHRTIPDDVVRQSNTLGYIGFANTAPNTRSTQVY